MTTKSGEFSERLKSIVELRGCNTKKFLKNFCKTP